MPTYVQLENNLSPLLTIHHNKFSIYYFHTGANCATILHTPLFKIVITLQTNT